MYKAHFLLCPAEQVCAVTQSELEALGVARNPSCTPIEKNTGIKLKTVGTDSRTCPVECKVGYYNPGGGSTLSCAVQNDDQEFGKWKNEATCLSA